jgi:hypothetical protein
MAAVRSLLTICFLISEPLPSDIPGSRRVMILTMQRNSFMISFVSYQMYNLKKYMHVNRTFSRTETEGKLHKIQFLYIMKRVETERNCYDLVTFL